MKTADECYNCGQLGHIARFCDQQRDGWTRNSHGQTRSQLRDYAMQRKQCFSCHAFGHIAQNCTAVPYGVRSARGRYWQFNGPPLSYSGTKHRQSRNSPRTSTEKKATITSATPSKSVAKTRGTKLEALANELLLMLFEYLPIVELLRAFHGLNSRFETLIFASSRVFHLDFGSVPKHDLDLFCRRYLPFMIDRITSLRLADRRNSVQQTKILSSCGIRLHQFINLRSLSLSYIDKKEVMNRQLLELPCLENLTHLTLSNCCVSLTNIGMTNLSNMIWSLPKLTHCYLGVTQYTFYEPTKTSSSIQCLSMMGYKCRLNQAIQLMKKTPHLRSLCFEHCDLEDDHYLSTPVPLITTLTLHQIRSTRVMRNLVKHMINLTRLKVETFYIKMDGHQWEQLILCYLPKLRILQFKMNLQYVHTMNNEQSVDMLLDSFRSRFWLEDHRWFVRCHRRPKESYSDILLYTLPLAFSSADKTIPAFPYKSTSLF